MALARRHLGALLLVLVASACSTDFGELFEGCPPGRSDCNGIVADGCEVEGPCGAGGAGASGSGGGPGSGGSGADLPHAQVMWSARIGDAGIQRARSIAADGDGNVVLAGYFFDSIVLEGQTHAAAGEHDVFLQKRDPDGQEIWSKWYGGLGNDTCRDVAVSAAGDIVLTGHFGDTIDFGGGQLVSEGLQDMFLVKLAADGSHVWSHSFGDPSEPQFGQSVALAADGTIYLGGQFSGSVDFGDGLLTSAGGSDIVVARLDAGGNTDWALAFGGPGYDFARSIAVDGDGVYVAGVYEGSVAVGGADLPGDESGNLFVARYDAGGAHVWSHGWGTGAEVTEAAMEVHPDGGVVVVGEFSGNLDVEGKVLTSDGPNPDVYVLRIDAGGTVIQAERYGSAEPEFAEGLAISSSGDAFLDGSLAGAIEIGGSPLDNVDGVDVLAARLAGTDFSSVWSRAYGGPEEQHAHAVGIDPQGFVLMAGCLYGNRSTIDFGDGVLQGAGEFDAWMVKLAP